MPHQDWEARVSLLFKTAAGMGRSTDLCVERGVNDGIALLVDAGETWKEEVANRATKSHRKEVGLPGEMRTATSIFLYTRKLCRL